MLNKLMNNEKVRTIAAVTVIILALIADAKLFGPLCYADTNTANPTAYGEWVQEVTNYHLNECWDAEPGLTPVCMNADELSYSVVESRTARNWYLVEYDEWTVQGFTNDGRAYGYGMAGQYLVSNKFTADDVEIGTMISSWFGYDNSTAQDGILWRDDRVFMFY